MTASTPKRRGRPPADPAAQAATAQDARNAICHAAVTLFQAGGVDAVNMRDIGKQLGTSQMMAYRYFPSKDHLLMELRIRAFSRFTQSLARWRRRARHPGEALGLVCGAYLVFAYANPHDYRLMFDMWAFESPETMKAEFGEKVRRQSASWLEIQAAIRDYLDVDAGADLGEATDIVWGSLHGMCSLHLARKLVFGRSLRQLARPTIAAIVAGVRIHKS
ncbi:TetR/AcrR family transcriptional regulator [Sphingobium sp.]|uniref:TetR/AcrR family transcriptional regulator n=1 Tax=Sphingobium sp. TaxID=1912891 RepID=UPI0025F54236|nr:TetR/AcrR family transcriptional regulator [Sphingobium sp.]